MILFGVCRLLNDLLLWEPLAPVPLDTQDPHSFLPVTGITGWSPELVPQLMRRGLVPDSFSTFKSTAQFGSSIYSISWIIIMIIFIVISICLKKKLKTSIYNAP